MLVALGGCGGSIGQHDGDGGPLDAPPGESGPGTDDAGPTDDAAGDDDGAPPTDAPPPDDAPAAAPYSFVVYGDNQFATESCTSGVNERLALPEAIKAAAPTFILHTGDLMDHGYDPGAYAKFVSCNQSMLDALAIFPTMGNHDAGSGAVWAYKTFLEELLQTRNPAAYGAGFATDFTIWYEDDPNPYSTDPSSPGSTTDVPSGFSFKTFYAVQFRRTLFVSLEVGTRWWSDTPKSWLRGHLERAQADAGVDHIVVFLHHPIYSTTMTDGGTGDSVGPVRAAYEPIIAAAHKVRLVFGGHAHVYDRMYVPWDGAATRTSTPPASYPLGAGIQYIVTGGGGGPLPDCSTFNPVQETSWGYSQVRRCGYHFLKVTVAGDRLTVDTTKVTGSATSYTTADWDHFTIE